MKAAMISRTIQRDIIKSLRRGPTVVQELDALRRMVEAMELLDEAARSRAIRYITSRYMPTPYYARNLS